MGEEGAEFELCSTLELKVKGSESGERIVGEFIFVKGGRR